MPPVPGMQQNPLPCLPEAGSPGKWLRAGRMLYLWPVYGVEKEQIGMRRVPVIDLSACTDCESCLEICPSVFRRNSETGLIEVVDLPDYPEEEVREAMALCPADCITWEAS